MLLCCRDHKGNPHKTAWFHNLPCPVCDALKKQDAEHDLTLAHLEEKIARLKNELEARNE